MRILIVDDDLELLSLISFALRQAGYFVMEAADGMEGLHMWEREQPDLVILDVNLPRLSGFDVLKQIRANATTPVMLLTARSSEEDQVQGLNLGADDYVTKPFSPRTLLARVRALLRRVGLERPAAQHAGAVQLDVEQHRVQIGDGEVRRLTNLEFRLLQHLVANAGHPILFDRLVLHVWGYRSMGDRQMLKQLVHRVRQKIEHNPAEPQYLVTVPNIGYLLRTTAR